MTMTSSDIGSGSNVRTDQHFTGNPINPGGASASVGHTWLIVIGALALLWLLGGVAFRKIRA